MSLLIANKADTEKRDRFGQETIQHSLIYGCAESVQLLLNSGCSLRFDLFNFDPFDSRPGNFRPGKESNVFMFALYLYHSPSELSFTRVSSNDRYEILKIVIRNLALRQGDSIPGISVPLILTRSEITRSNDCQNSRSNAAQARTSSPSPSEGDPQSQDIFPHMRTVYHFSFLTVKVANELWNAGFRDVDVPDEDDKTPLMMLRPCRLHGHHNHKTEMIESALWLHQKGASLHQPCSPTLPPGLKNVGTATARSERRAVHFVTAAVETCLYDAAFSLVREKADTDDCYRAEMEPLIDDLSFDAAQLLCKILLDTSPDACLCACSRHGCMPMTLLLKRSTSFHGLEVDGHISAWAWRWFLDNVPTDQIPTANSQKILRLITFEAMGLRHTCCYYCDGDFYGIGSEEAAEIRDEDHEGIQLLETLLLEFEERRGDEDVKSFIDGYWGTRMNEVRAAREEAVDRARIREIGVVLDDDH